MLKRSVLVNVLIIFYLGSVLAQVTIEWERSYGGSNWDKGRSILETEDGGYIFIGNTGSDDGDIPGGHFNRNT